MFNAGVNRALNAAAALINTAEGPRSAKHTPDTLNTVEDLRSFLDAQDPELQWSDAAADGEQLKKVRELRATLRRIWEAGSSTEVELQLINGLLEGVGTQLVRSAAAGEPDIVQTPVPISAQTHHVMTATIAAAISHLVVAEETGRLRICRGDDCQAAIVDLTRNRSKLFCDFGNCANRAHVRAYRARQAAQQKAGDTGSKRPASPRSRPSAAEKAEELSQPTSDSGVAAKEFRNRMRDELMETRQKKSKKKKKKKDSKKK